MTYSTTMDGIDLYIPLRIPKDNLEAVRQYAVQLRLAHPSKKIEVWDSTKTLIDL